MIKILTVVGDILAGVSGVFDYLAMMCYNKIHTMITNEAKRYYANKKKT